MDPATIAVDPHLVAERVAGRKLAAELLALIDSEAQALTPEGRAAMLGQLRLHFLPPPATPAEAWSNLELPAGVEPMSDQAARTFGRRRFPFGKYVGTPIDEVPIDYLVNLIEDSPFKLQLRRYLASPRIAREVEQTDILWLE